MAEIKKEWAEKGYKADNSPSIGWITACDEDELSLDWGSYYGGKFTYNFVNAWKSASTDANGDGFNDFLEIFDVAAPLATDMPDGNDEDDVGRVPQKLNDDVLASVAAWRLVRAGAPKEPRDWRVRWDNAWAAVGGEGAHRTEFVALKNSPIWEALGEYGDDSTGSDCPPFAYNSTMDWEDVPREEAVALGLLGEDEGMDLEFDGGLGEGEIAEALADLSDEDAAALAEELEQWV